MKLGAKLLPIPSPCVSTKRPTAKTDPAAASTPSTCRTREISPAPGRPAARPRRDHPAGPRSRRPAPFSDSLKMSLNDWLIVSAEDVGPGHQRDPEEDREPGGEGAHLARAEPAQRDLRQPPATSFISSITLGGAPGRGVVHHQPVARGRTSRSAYAAALGVVGDHHHGLAELVDRAGAAGSSTSAPAVESRLPVGSSAKTTAGSVTRARAHGHALLLAAGQLATGGASSRSPRPTVSTSRVEPLGGRARGRRSTSGSVDVLLGGQHRDQVEELEDETELVAPQLGERGRRRDPDELGSRRGWTVPDVGPSRPRQGCASGSTCPTPRAP